MRLPSGRFHLRAMGGSGAKVGDSPKWTGTEWKPGAAGGDSDHDGTGANSTAVGTLATASGTDDTSVGDGAAASGGRGVAFGRSAVCSGNEAIAIGRTAAATGANATAIGNSSLAQGSESTAIGDDAETNAAGGTAIGAISESTNVNGTALGYFARTQANRAIAIGANSFSATDDHGVIRINELELNESSGSAGTSLILHDTVDDSRWRISVASGVLVVAPA